MRSVIYYPAVLAGLLSLLACRENIAVQAQNIDKQQLLEKSLIDWQLAKKQRNSAYQYSVHFSSWVGFRSQTQLTVIGDGVVKREYQAFDREGKKVVDWQENNTDELATHKRGAPVKTIDQLYTQCQTEILSKPKQENYLNLSFDDRNLLRQCTYMPKNCADDCSFDVNISNLRFIQKP